VQQRVELANQLTSTLKTYFPAALELRPAKIYADFMVKFLSKFSSLHLAQAAGKAKLRKYFFGVGAKQKAEDRIETLIQAKRTQRGGHEACGLRDHGKLPRFGDQDLGEDDCSVGR